MSELPLDQLTELAGRLVDASGAVIRRYFRNLDSVEEKSDHTPVTVADRGAEAAIRALLTAERPGDGIYGEEYGASALEAEYVWVIDPIDGTKAFVSGRPTFGTLVALCRRGVPVLGVIDQPVIGDRWIGVTGRPTLWNGRPVHTRGCGDLAAAVVSTTTPDMYTGANRDGYLRLAAGAKLMLYGGDCYAYGLLAAGFQDAVIDASMKIYDYAALVPVVAGAGGVITDWSGAPLGFASDGTVLAAANPGLHAEALAKLRPDGGTGA